MTVAGYLRRRKRDLDLLAASPRTERLCRGILLGGGAMLLSAIPGRGQNLPFGAALAAASPGLWSILAALGAAAGYRLFWPEGWPAGLSWTLLALAVSALLHAAKQKNLLLRGGLFGILCGLTGFFFHSDALTGLLRGCAGCLGVWIPGCALETGHPTALLLSFSLGLRAMAAAGLGGLACAAAGAAAAAGPLPAAVLSGAALEWAGLPGMTFGLCAAWMLRQLPVKEPWRRGLGPWAGCILGMALGRNWNIGAWLGVSTGGLLGALIPWSLLLPPTVRGTAGAQVQLEQEARVLARMQRLLLEIPGFEDTFPDRAEQLKNAACTDCPRTDSCPQKCSIDDSVFTDPLSFSCPHTSRVLREAARLRERQRLLEGQHKRLTECRMAVAQQYGMLSRYLQRLADSLPLRLTVGQIRYRVSVSVRSREKYRADGDRCAAFPGIGPRFYILLCDGMGTGLPAAAEAGKALKLLQGMLTAGLPPGSALKSLNSQLLLTGGTGAVTADLCELRLDTGYASLYKWGAAPSLLLSSKTIKTIGTPGLPPGMELGASGERIARLSLQKGETLVLASDGVTFDDSLVPRSTIEPTGPLAERLLNSFTSGEDDATLAVIRLGPLRNAG